jgi:hypothetical protein
MHDDIYVSTVSEAVPFRILCLRRGQLEMDILLESKVVSRTQKDSFGFVFLPKLK